MPQAAASSAFPAPDSRDRFLQPNLGTAPLRAQSAALFAGQNRALHALLAGAPLTAVFTALVESVEADLSGEATAAILLLDEDGKRLRHGAAPSLPDSYNQAVDGIAIGPDIGTCCAAAARNEVVITTDIANDPGWAALKELPLGIGLRSAWSMPIRSAEGKVLGTFGTYFRTCRAPTDLEREIVGVMANTAGLAIEHRATIAALRENESFLQGVMAASPDCVKVIGLDGRLMWMSDRGRCLMQVSDFEQVRGAGWEEFWPEENTRRAARTATEVASHGELGRFQGFCPTLAGEPRWWDVVVTAIHDADGDPEAFLSVSRDITEARQAEAALAASEERLRALALDLDAQVQRRTAELAASNTQLRTEMNERQQAERARRELLEQLGCAEEQERKRISRELHDELGQHLAELRLGLDALRGLQPAGAAYEKLAQLQGVLETMGRGMHEIAVALRPSALDDFGLGRAVADYVKQCSARTGLAIELHQTGGRRDRLPSTVETALYRIVQEALTNVLKHARARHVSVLLELEATHAAAIIEDDGAGFDLAEVRANGHGRRGLGLPGMRERAALLGGELKIESELGRGTAVFVRIPLESEGGDA